MTKPPMRRKAITVAASPLASQPADARKHFQRDTLALTSFSKPSDLRSSLMLSEIFSSFSSSLRAMQGQKMPMQKKTKKPAARIKARIRTPKRPQHRTQKGCDSSPLAELLGVEGDAAGN